MTSEPSRRRSSLRDLLTAARRGLRAGRLEAYRYLRDRREAAEAAGGHEPDVVASAVTPAGVAAEIAVYFADPPGNHYQLAQWLPILERLDERHPVVVVCRSAATVEAVEPATSVPVVLVRSLGELGGFYAAVGVKVCLYVNHHHLNFLSLTFADQLHVHLNHGESDKVSMASNQARAYDRVLVAGDAAVDRYRANLLGFDESRLVRVGRPQLDLLPPSLVPAGGNRTALYAPTWEGARDEMAYSSVAAMGERIVAALADAGWRVIYRPHPTTGTVDPATAGADERIRRRLSTQDTAAAGHRVSPADEPIGEAFADAEVLIADVSSVLVDFLATGRPVAVTRPPEATGHLVAAGGEVPSLAVAYPVTVDDIATLPARLERLRDDDPLRDARMAMVDRLFGDTTRGAATARFLAAIDAIVEERDRLVADRATRRSATAPAGIREPS